MNPLNPLRRSCSRRRCHVLALDRIEDLVDAPPPPGIEVRVVTEADADRVRDFRDDGVVHIFRSGVVCSEPGVYAWKDGRVVGHFASYCWGVHGRNRRTGIELERGDAWLHDGHVRDGLRGLGIFQAMIRALTKALFADPDIRRVVSDVNVGDAASLAAHRKCGFRVLGELRYLRALDIVLQRKFIPVP